MVCSKVVFELSACDKRAKNKLAVHMFSTVYDERHLDPEIQPATARQWFFVSLKQCSTYSHGKEQWRTMTNKRTAITALMNSQQQPTSYSMTTHFNVSWRQPIFFPLGGQLQKGKEIATMAVCWCSDTEQHHIVPRLSKIIAWEWKLLWLQRKNIQEYWICQKAERGWHSWWVHFPCAGPGKSRETPSQHPAESDDGSSEP
jgi:hypothetical protein